MPQRAAASQNFLGDRWCLRDPAGCGAIGCAIPRVAASPAFAPLRCVLWTVLALVKGRAPVVYLLPSFLSPNSILNPLCGALRVSLGASISVVKVLGHVVGGGGGGGLVWV